LLNVAPLLRLLIRRGRQTGFQPGSIKPLLLLSHDDRQIERTRRSSIVLLNCSEINTLAGRFALIACGLTPAAARLKI
jgi:hypothetical protein